MSELSEKIRIAASILAADFSKLGQEIYNVIHAGADWIHIDIMDNHYVPNLTIGPMVCEAIRPYATVPVDIHLMTSSVDKLIPKFADAGAEIITFHPETSKHIDRSLSIIHECGCKAGLAINPATSLECIKYVMEKLDVLLIMSVNPGFGGQKLIPSSLKKISKARHIIDSWVQNGGQNIYLEVDGGIKEDNINSISKAGADTFVIGSAIFGKSDYKTEILSLRKKISNSKSQHDKKTESCKAGKEKAIDNMNQ